MMPVSKGKINILVIEDNPGDFVLIEEYLQEEIQKVSIHHAKTFNLAKNIISREPKFDVILLDLTLPDASGEQLVGEALKIAGDTPLIVLTGYANKGFSIKTLGLGVADYLLKDDLTATQLFKSIAYSIERKRVNNELKVSEEKYRNLFHSSPLPTWVYDPETFRFLDVNESACRHYGYSKEEFLAMTIKDIRPKEDIKIVEAIVNEHKGRTSYYEGVFSHYKKSGELIHVNIQSNNINFSGQSARLVVSTDITEKIRAENALKQSNDRYNLVSKATSDAIWDYTFNTNKTYIAGTGYKHLFGYDIVDDYTDDLFWEQRLHPDDKKNVMEKLRAFIADASQSQCSCEYRFMKADGTYAYVNDRLFILRENGIPVRLIGAINDITKRKEEEQHLKLLESVITNTSDAVMITEADFKGKSGPGIIYVNESFTRMSGYSKNEIIGKTPDILLGPESDRKEFIRLQQAFQNHETCNIEMVNYARHGSKYWVEIDAAPVTGISGRISHMITIQRDITSRKLQEQEREKLIFELIQNNKDLRQFSYITSHNLRGPIASMMGLTSLLSNYKIEDPTLARILDGIKKAAARFDETIKDLTAVLNIKDRLSIPREELNLSVIYKKTLLHCESFIKESGATIENDFSKAPALHFNKAYLESILMNLLTNAVKYRSATRDLAIKVTSEELRDEVVLKFKDNGMGFDKELHKEKLFGLYQRFHEHVEGKGMGLFLIKSQMEALNGTIEVDSKVDEGTLFTLKFRK